MPSAPEILEDVVPEAASRKTAAGSSPAFRFSGHQTFALRIAWIPKAVRAICSGRDPLTQVDEGITTLGLGKNMVEALRCWIEAFQVAEKIDGNWKLSHVGDAIFHPENGFDPYLEDVSTPWVLHWLITTNTTCPFFAWECLFNRWPSAEFSPSQVIEAFEEESKKSGKPASEVTLRQHWEVFLHSYRPARGAKNEDHLDSALSMLRLIKEVSERPNASGKWETLYSFETGKKSSIPQELFSFFLETWWESHYRDEQTVSLRDIVLGDHSPGRILKMEEREIVSRLADLERMHSDTFEIVESMNLRQLRLHRTRRPLRWLKAAYETPHFI